MSDFHMFIDSLYVVVDWVFIGIKWTQRSASFIISWKLENRSHQIPSWLLLHILRMFPSPPKIKQGLKKKKNPLS